MTCVTNGGSHRMSSIRCLLDIPTSDGVYAPLPKFYQTFRYSTSSTRFTSNMLGIGQGMMRRHRLRIARQLGWGGNYV